MAVDHSAEGYQPISEAQAVMHADAAERAPLLTEPTLCPSCGAVFYDGRWRWGIAPERLHEETCPACRRIQTHHPAAELVLGGPFVADRGAEITALMQETEARVKAGLPLARLIGIERHAEGLLLTTTSMHLARDLAQALHHAFRGEVRYLYNPERKFLRVLWTC